VQWWGLCWHRTERSRWVHKQNLACSDQATSEGQGDRAVARCVPGRVAAMLTSRAPRASAPQPLPAPVPVGEGLSESTLPFGFLDSEAVPILMGKFVISSVNVQAVYTHRCLYKQTLLLQSCVSSGPCRSAVQHRPVVPSHPLPAHPCLPCRAGSFPAPLQPLAAPAPARTVLAWSELVLAASISLEGLAGRD